MAPWCRGYFLKAAIVSVGNDFKAAPECTGSCLQVVPESANKNLPYVPESNEKEPAIGLRSLLKITRNPPQSYAVNFALLWTFVLYSNFHGETPFHPFFARCWERNRPAVKSKIVWNKPVYFYIKYRIYMWWFVFFSLALSYVTFLFLFFVFHSGGLFMCT